MHESEKWKWSRSVVSNSLRPHGLQPTRLLHPWDFPGKSTGVGCHCLLHYLYLEGMNSWGIFSLAQGSSKTDILGTWKSCWTQRSRYRYMEVSRRKLKDVMTFYLWIIDKDGLSFAYVCLHVCVFLFIAPLLTQLTPEELSIFHLWLLTGVPIRYPWCHIGLALCIWNVGKLIDCFK